MLPPGHAAVGYLTLSLVRRAWRRDVPVGASMPWLLAGTQLPDLVDKPLAWGVAILPSARSLGHSLLFAVPLLLLVDRWLRRRDRAAASEGFAIGYLSHLLTDALSALPGGPEWITFLVWPLLPAPRYAWRPPIWPPHLLLSSLEIGLGLVIVGLWIVDGMPGIVYIRLIRNRLSSGFAALED